MSQAYVVINNQQIYWSFIQKIRNQVFRGDWGRTIDAFWRARHATGENAVMRYMQQGLKADDKGRKYLLYPSETYVNNRESIMRWWNDEVYKPKRAGKKEPAKVADIFKQIAAGVES